MIKNIIESDSLIPVLFFAMVFTVILCVGLSYILPPLTEMIKATGCGG